MHDADTWEGDQSGVFIIITNASISISTSTSISSIGGNKEAR